MENFAIAKKTNKVKNTYDKNARHTHDPAGQRGPDDNYEEEESQPGQSDLPYDDWTEMKEESKGRSPNAIMEGGSAEKSNQGAFKEYDAAHEDRSDEEEIAEDDPNNVSLDYSEAGERRETVRLTFKSSSRLRKAAGLSAEDPLRGLSFVYVDV